MSIHCTRHASLHAETCKRVTRGRTAPQLTERRRSLCAVLLRLTDFRSEAVISKIHTFRVRCQQGRCCSVRHRKGFGTTAFHSLTTCWHSLRSREQRTQEGTSGSVYARSCATAVSGKTRSSRLVTNTIGTERCNSSSLHESMTLSGIANLQRSTSSPRSRTSHSGH